MVFEPGAAAPTRLTRSGGRSRWTVGLGDVDRRVGFAYTMTAVFGNLTGDPRPHAVVDALEG
jgi:hypothetical protein